MTLFLSMYFIIQINIRLFLKRFRQLKDKKTVYHTTLARIAYRYISRQERSIG